MGYAGLIERQSPKDATYLRSVAVILSEAERMASIVKKIGRITKYETTDYVGGARMLDLERAAPDSDAAIPVASDEVQTGEFPPVASPANTTQGLSPSVGDLRALGDLRDPSDPGDLGDPGDVRGREGKS